MKTEAVNIDNYIGVEPDEQFEFLYNNFFVMENMIKEYREDLIKEVIEQKAFNRRSNSGDLGVRIQVSLGISNPTQNMAIDRILVSQAIDEGYLTEEFFQDTDDRENLIHKVTCYHYINNDYLQFNRKLHQMEPIEQKLWIEIRRITMAAKANESNLLSSYRMADPEGRLEIMFANYHIFPKVIRKMEKKTKYKIKAEKEYVRSHNRGELGVRVQTSNLSDVTADEAIDNVMLEEALRTGDVTAGLLKGIDNLQTCLQNWRKENGI